MPHAQINHSDDLSIDPAVLPWIEAEILRHDAGAGECKGRIYPAATFHHSHVHVAVSLLPKAHRDDTFMQRLLAALDAGIPQFLSQPCFFSLELTFSSAVYVTRTHPG